jgi:hypothetical protein
LVGLEFVPWSDPGPITDPPAGPTEEVLYRLTDNLHHLEVFVDSRQWGTLVLSRAGDVFSHPRLPTWGWVGLLQETLRPAKSFRGHRHPLPDRHLSETVCLWVHPVKEGPLTLRFADVPLGHRFLASVKLRSSYDPKASSRYRVVVDGEKIHERLLQSKAGSIEELDVMLPGTGTGTLEWVWETVVEGKNHLCVEGVVLQTPDVEAGP